MSLDAVAGGPHPGGESGCQALDSRQTVEPGVEAHDLRDSLLLHDGQVNRVSGGETVCPQNDGLGSIDDRAVHREYLVDDAEQDVEGWLDRIAAPYRDIAMKDLLQHLGIGHQPSALGNEPLQQALRVGLVGVGGSHEIHRDIGIDKDHGRSAAT